MRSGDSSLPARTPLNTVSYIYEYSYISKSTIQNSNYSTHINLLFLKFKNMVLRLLPGLCAMKSN